MKDRQKKILVSSVSTKRLSSPFHTLEYSFSFLLSLFRSSCRALYDMWALTMMGSFTHQRSEASLTEREGPPQTLTESFTSFPINYWHAVVSWKASQTFRWSVWWIFQLTNRPPDTLHQSYVWLERGRSSWPQSCTYARTCIYSYSVVVAVL